MIGLTESRINQSRQLPFNADNAESEDEYANDTYHRHDSRNQHVYFSHKPQSISAWMTAKISSSATAEGPCDAPR